MSESEEAGERRMGINGVVLAPQDLGLSSSADAAPTVLLPSVPPSTAASASTSQAPPPQTAKRKRGRPRKYGPDAAMAPPPLPTSPPVPPTVKRAQGRPPGSTKKLQLEALASAGLGFTPHIITVQTGEDVSSKIISFPQQGSRAVCILSANGAISNVTLRQRAISGGSVTYEGRFEIISLSGTFMFSENSGQRIRTGDLNISLSGPDGRVVGGSVAGLLTAASPVQVVVGSFIANDHKDANHVNQMETSPTEEKQPLGGAGPSSVGNSD